MYTAFARTTIRSRSIQPASKFSAVARSALQIRKATQSTRLAIDGASTQAGYGKKTANMMRASEATGSTPPDFIPPPDRIEYHPYRLVIDANSPHHDWIDEVDLEIATALQHSQSTPLRFLVLYGSLRKTSYSRLLAFEMARLLEVCKSTFTPGHAEANIMRI